nr:transposase [Nitrospirales bacterium]
MKTQRLPQTLVEAINYFSDRDRALACMTSIRWPDGHVICPRCSSAEVTFLANARVWKCRVAHAQQKFSIKVGTIMEDSPIPLEKWMPAI